MLYVLTYSKIMPGTPEGYVSDLLEDWFDNSRDAEKRFNNMPLSPEYFRKEIWVKDASGARKLLKEERFSGRRDSKPRN